MLCPCGSVSSYKECCEVFHNGGEPPTALLLMRSRYAAYALTRVGYIQRTTHSKNPAFELDRKKWTASILEFCQNTEFLRLEIAAYGDDWVSFIAHLKQGGKLVDLRERSLFAKENSHWRYLSGDVSVDKALSR